MVIFHSYVKLPEGKVTHTHTKHVEIWDEIFELIRNINGRRMFVMTSFLVVDDLATRHGDVSVAT